MQSVRQSRLVRRIAYAIERPGMTAALDVDPGILREVKSANRAFLASVPQWIEDSDYQNSIFNYGLAASVRDYLNDPMTDETTYSDLISTLAKCAGSSLRYLELGVSVGKNFAQVMHSAHGAQLTGFDIENVNPTLEKMLTKVGSVEWATMEGSKRKTSSTLTSYTHAANSNQVRYLAGDIFDDNSWERLRGGSFNMIFSDAFHSAEALLKEWEMIKKTDILSRDGFVMLWDDLGSRAMRFAYYRIVEELRRAQKRGAVSAGIRMYRGWLGRRGPYHPLGFVKSAGIST